MLLEKGYAVAPGVLGPEELRSHLALARSILERRMTEDYKKEHLAIGSLLDILKEPEGEGFVDLIARPIHLLRPLGFDDVRFKHGVVFNKPPHTPRTFWHQDGSMWQDPASYREAPLELVLLFYLVDTSPENGCLRVIPGSHRRAHPLHKVLRGSYTPELRRMEDPSSPAFQSFPEEESVPVKAGDLVVMDARLLHAAHANGTDADRTALSLWYFPSFKSLPEAIRARYTGLAQPDRVAPFLPGYWPNPAKEKFRPLLPPPYEGGTAPLPTCTIPNWRRLRILRKFRSVPPAVRLLLLTDLTFAAGFHMLIPFLAARCVFLGLSAWLAGLVLGLRNFSQQGFYLVGGSLADRTDCKSLMVAGCLGRAAGFALFGLAQGVLGLVVAMLLSGLAAALLLPAMKTYTALTTDGDPEVFALSEALQRFGVLMGPLIGMLLLGAGFRVVAFAAAGLYLAWAAFLALRLPGLRGVESGSREPLAASWAQALGNRSFLLFSLAMALSYAIMVNQLYLCLPLELTRLTGRDSSAGWILALSGAIVIAGQMWVTETCSRRWGPSLSICLGLGLMGTAFLPLWALPRPSAALVFLSVALLTFGMKAVFPFAMQLVPAFGEGRRTGVHYGIFYLAWGLGGTVGNMAAGSLFERSPSTAWGCLAAAGWLAALVLAAMRRRALFPIISGPFSGGT